MMSKTKQCFILKLYKWNKTVNVNKFLLCKTKLSVSKQEISKVKAKYKE